MRHYREGNGEALTGARAGQVLSHEILQSRGADGVNKHGKQHLVVRYCKSDRDPAGSETLCMLGNTLRENRESQWFSGEIWPLGYIGKSKDVRR